MTTLPATGPVTSPPRPPAALRMTPGRWVTLVIGVPIALAFIGWSGFSLVAGIGQASFPVSTTIPVKHGRLAASTGGGDITVHLSCTLHQSVPPVERERRVLYTGFRLPPRGTDAERAALERLRAIREDAPTKAPSANPA